MDIDLIEKRLAALELQVLPKNQQTTPLDQSKDLPVVDLLLQTQSITATALSCRDIVTSILHRMETISDYLNPNYYQVQMDIQHKRQYILELYPAIRKSLELMSEFEQLQHIVDSIPINNIPNLGSQLQHLTIKSIDTFDNCNFVTGNILNTLQRYNDLTLTIKTIFLQMEEAITDIEMSLKTV